MALNPDMTLREFFELAERVGAAANVIREAQAMMGGAPVAPQWGPGPAAAILGDQQIKALRDARDASPVVSIADAKPRTNKGPVEFTAAELADRARLKMQAEREAAETEKAS